MLPYSEETLGTAPHVGSSTNLFGAAVSVGKEGRSRKLVCYVSFLMQVMAGFYGGQLTCAFNCQRLPQKCHKVFYNSTHSMPPAPHPVGYSTLIFGRAASAGQEDGIVLLVCLIEHMLERWPIKANGLIALRGS